MSVCSARWALIYLLRSPGAYFAPFHITVNGRRWLLLDRLGLLDCGPPETVLFLISFARHFGPDIGPRIAQFL